MEKNIITTKWDTLFLSMTLQETDWTVINLTGATIILNIKKKIEDETALIEKNATILYPLTWKCEIKVEWTTMNISIWNYYYDIQYMSSDNQISTFLKWFLTVTYEVTD